MLLCRFFWCVWSDDFLAFFYSMCCSFGPCFCGVGVLLVWGLSNSSFYCYFGLCISVWRVLTLVVSGVELRVNWCFQLLARWLECGRVCNLCRFFGRFLFLGFLLLSCVAGCSSSF